jgi:hypothetical protein
LNAGGLCQEEYKEIDVILNLNIVEQGAMRGTTALVY